MSNSLPPMNCSLPGSSGHGTYQARILEWIVISSSRGFSSLRDRTRVSCVSCIVMRIIYHWPTFSSVQSLSRVWFFATPWTVARQASLSITSFRSLLKLMSIESVMPSNYLILWCPLLLMPSIFPSIRVFASESVLLIRWLRYWSFSFSISPSNDYSGLI